MKILVIHTKYRFKGGEDSVVDAEIDLLKKHSHEICLLDFRNSSNNLITFVLFLKMFFNIFSFFRTIRAISKFRPDLVHVHNWYFAASPAVFVAARIKRIPVIYTLHNFRLICPSGLLFQNGSLFLDSIQQKFPWKAIQKKVYRNSYFQTFWLGSVIWVHDRLGTWRSIDGYIALTEFAKELFLLSKRNWLPHQFNIKPNFVENVIENIRTTYTPNFLYIGRLSEEKGVDVLIKALSIHDFNLIIIGDGPLKPKVEALASAKPNIVKYLGFQDKTGIYDNLNLCTALIMPSIWYEGMPITLLEAFSAGVPVIASNLGSISLMIQDGYNGLLFDAGHPSSLVNCIQKWQSYSDKQKNIFCQNARKTYEELYTPEKNYMQLIDIYQSVINKKSII